MHATGQAIVYIVDDDPNVRFAERMLLELEGFHVIECPCAEDLLGRSELASDGPQCLLLDLHLPGMSGPELQQELLRRESRLPIIVQTGYSDLTPAVQAMKAGALEVLQKPVGAAELIECVLKAHALDLARRNREKERRAFQDLLSTLSAREREVMEGLTVGARVKELSARLRIGEQTVLKHRASMLKKLGAKNEVQLVMLLADHEVRPSSPDRTARTSTSLEKGLLNTGVSSLAPDNSSHS